MGMGPGSHLSRIVVLVLLLLLPASTWAEYCKSQGQNPLPRKEAKQYEDEAWLGPSEDRGLPASPPALGPP